MKIINLICIVVLIAASSCNTQEECAHEAACQKENYRVIEVVVRLDELGRSVHCVEASLDVSSRVEKIVDKLQPVKDIATLASISRSLRTYENPEVPTCINSKADNVFDHAFWICINRLSSSKDVKAKEYLEKLKENSSLILPEKMHFDEVIAAN